MLKNAIRQAALEATGIVRAHRRHIHLNPEPSFSEEKTGAYVARALNEMGIVHSTGWCADRGAAGIVAHIEGSEPGVKQMALRADMDALPIQEVDRPPCQPGAGMDARMRPRCPHRLSARGSPSPS